MQGTIGFVGAGQMATALAKGFVERGLVSASQLVACDVAPAALERFVAETGGRSASSAGDVLNNAAVVILATKPQHMGEALPPLAAKVTSDHLLISIAAGVPLAKLEGWTRPAARWARVMPNTPALVGCGASGFSLNAAARPDDAETVRALFAAVGLAHQVPESLLDAVTGLSGSGPAYAYAMIEALSDGGVRVGLPRAIATQLAAQTLLGAAQMVLKTGQHPGALKDAVTSPGGTTIAGLHAIEQGGLRGVLMNAVQAATERAKELGRS